MGFSWLSWDAKLEALSKDCWRLGSLQMVAMISRFPSSVNRYISRYRRKEVGRRC